MNGHKYKGWHDICFFTRYILYKNMKKQNKLIITHIWDNLFEINTLYKCVILTNNL